MDDASAKSIVAAGGIVLGLDEHAGHVLLVRRRRYEGEVALPKGKVQGHESLQQAALREVEEETGLTPKVRGYAGSTHYFVGGLPKAVFYYVMDASGEGHSIDSAEIASVEWSTPAMAIAMLTHRQDRDLVSAVFGIRER